MDTQLVVICLLTAGINLIGTLAYAARIAGVRTRRIATSLALFNVLVLFSRTANGFLGPFLASRIETRLADGGGDTLVTDFRLVLLAGSVAVLLGVALIPMAQRLFVFGINDFQKHRSVIRLVLSALKPAGLRAIRASAAVPTGATLKHTGMPPGITWQVLAANALAQMLLATGVLASLYAGYLNPEFRVTASQLSAVINGVATILLFAFIDPQVSALTDDALDGEVSDGAFRRAIGWISMSRLAGTLLAQAVFVPAAVLVAWLANLF
ncbi:MAG: lipid II flippase Amj family protein [Alteraurantiacibacter sp.]